MTKNVIDISFIGQDYSSLNNAIVKDFKGEVIDLSDVFKQRFLIGFLDKVSKKTLVIGTSETGDKTKGKLYDPEWNCFGGVVGVITDTFNMEISDFANLDKDLQTLKSKFNYDENIDRLYFNVKLQIQSRMDVNKDKKIAKPYFLSTLLLHDRVKFNDNTIPNSEDELYDYLLLFWFKEQLQNAYLKGFYRKYQRFERNDDRLKGTIDIARHIRMNMGQDNGKIAYSYRENSVNNYLNHLIVAAYEYLKKKYYDLVMENFDNIAELKAIIDTLKNEIGYPSYNIHTLISKNLKPIAHPYYTEYEDLRKTCLRILRNEGISIFDGDMDETTKGILFYLPDLWEKYLEDTINNAIDKSSVRVESQCEIKSFGYRGENDKDFSYKQKIRPDYVIKDKKDVPFMILDAKFKPKWEDVLEHKATKISDVLSDYDKCLRDMVSIDAHAVGVIFPTNKFKSAKSKSIASAEFENIESAMVHSISEYNVADNFYTIPAFIPFIEEGQEYSKWKANLDASMKKTQVYIGEKIVYEKEFYEKISSQKKAIEEARKERTN